MRAQITLRNGVQIEADVTQLTTTRSPVTNELVGLKWTTPDGWSRSLHTIEVGEIAAIVMIDDEPSPQKEPKRPVICTLDADCEIHPGRNEAWHLAEGIGS